MIKKILFIGLPVALIGGAAYFYFFILKKSNEHFKLIPSSSYVVVTADLKSLAEKANVTKWEELYVSKKMNESTKPDAENSRFVKDVFSNPLSMGIDPFSDLYFFFQYTDQFQPSFGVAFAVRNAKDLEEVLMKIPDDNLAVEKKEVIEKDGYKLFRLSSTALIAWKNGAGLLAGGMDADGLDQYADKVMKQEKSASLADNEYFLEFAKMNQDIGVFINYAGVFNSNVGAMAAASAQNNSYVNTFKTAYATLSVLFEKDNIAIKSNYYNSNPDAFGKYGFLSDKKVSDATLKSLTSKNALAYYGFTFDIKKLIELFESDKSTGKMYEDFTKEFGLTKDEVKNLLGGELAVSLNDFYTAVVQKSHYNWDEKTNDMVEEMRDDTVMIPEFSLALSVGDKNALHKLFDHFKLPKDSTGVYSTVMGGYTYYFVESSAGLTITNGKNTAAELYSKKEYPAVLSGKAGETAKSAAAVLYWNLNLSEYPEVVRTELKKEMKEADYNLFADYMSMFAYTDGKFDAKKGDMNVFMSKSEENSLWRIIKKTDAVFKKSEEDRKASMQQMEEMMKQDSIAAAEQQNP